MNTFKLTLSDSWQDVLQGRIAVHFDVLSSAGAEMYLTDDGTSPDASDKGHPITSWGNDWDVSLENAAPGQSLWVKGSGVIRGIR